MKSQSIITTFLAAALVGGLYGSGSAAAQPNPWGDIVNEAGRAAGPPCEMMPPAPSAPGGLQTMRGSTPPPCLLECLKKLLELTGDQRKRIAAFVAEEQENSIPLLKKQSEIRQQLHRAEQAAPFDESVVRKLAGSLAPIETELIVIRARIQNSILSVLTPEQRRLTEKLEPSKDPRQIPPPPGVAPGKTRAEQ
jgi:Spy/CpxP family protein refolding chaperone